MNETIVYPDGTNHYNGRFGKLPQSVELLNAVSVQVGDNQYKIFADNLTVFGELGAIELRTYLTNMRNTVIRAARTVSRLEEDLAKSNREIAELRLRIVRPENRK